MRNKKRKKILIIILSAVLVGNSLQMPKNTNQVFAQEIEHEYANMESGADTKEADFINNLMHIGQTVDIDDFSKEDDSEYKENTSYKNDAQYKYDTPIYITPATNIYLFVDEDTEEVMKEIGGTLTWSILRGKKGEAPGTTNIVNGNDDWENFETVSSSPLFSIKEEEENNGIYKKLVVTANDMLLNDDYDYYIRAAFQSMVEQIEYAAVTTLPVLVDESKNKEEAETIVSETEEFGTIEEDNFETEEETLETKETDTEEGVETSETDIKEGVEISTETNIEEDIETSETDIEEGLETDTAETPEGFFETVEMESLLEGQGETDVVVGVNKIIINKTSATMNPGDVIKPIVTIVPEGLNLDIKWSSSNEETAVVDETGNITALADGMAEITAECGGKTANIMIDVVKTDAEINNDRPIDKDGNMIEISDQIWVAGFERENQDMVYSGNKITQNLRIYHKGTLLKEKTDYVLTYKNNVNAALYNSTKAPSVTITMKGQYTGSQTLYFTIAPRNIDEEQSLGYEQVINYNKNLTIPQPVLYYGSKKLVLKKDFTCDYSSLPENYKKGDSYEIGKSYEYTVNGINNFTGSFTMKITVIKNKNFNLANASITLDKKEYEYHGKALDLSEVGIVSVKFGKTILDSNLYEYSVCAEGAGTGYVEVYPSEAGKIEGYRGIKKLKIKVVGDRKIKETKLGNGFKDSITFSKTELENKGGICQESTNVLLYGEGDSSEFLTEGIDYTVKYSNNKKVGTATVTFTGIGRYTGSIKKTYKIVPNTDLHVLWNNLDEEGVPVTSYIKGGAVPQFELQEYSENGNSILLNSKTDYTIKVTNNKKVGIMTCEINGKGNYKGYKSITEIKIISGDIGQGTISLKDMQYSKKINAWKSAVTITDKNGKKLSAGTDYNKNLVYSYEGIESGTPPEAGTIVYVTATGINNYEGSSITGSYRIYSNNISKLIVKIEDQEYTGKDIELLPEDIHVYANKNDYNAKREIEESCYEIISYSNNIKAGTAKVTLRGIGEYGGTKVYSFKILKKKYLISRVTGISLVEKPFTLGLGKSKTLTAVILPEDAENKTIIWTSSNSKVLEVNSEGVVTAKQPGKATIKATSQDTGKKASCNITVAIIPVTSFSLNTEEIRQEAGTQYQLTATEIQPIEANYSTILWETSNSEIATVDNNGKVYLKKAGMAVITAYTSNRNFEKKCLVFVNGEEETEMPEDTYVTPQMFRTCNENDDTKAFNEAINSLGGECNTVYVPAGTYKIDAVTSIRLKSNMNFIMSPNAVLEAVNNSSGNYNIIRAMSISNVTISGGQIRGERYGHSGNSGEWGMGIGLYDSASINVIGVTISNCWGDGIYVGSDHEEQPNSACRNIKIKDCNVFSNRRNNLSIVCADYITVDNCTFNNAGGTAPGYGIDIEPNLSTSICRNITISNATFSGNAQASIGIITSANIINISNCTLNNPFINYAGTNVTISNSVINAKTYARVGVSLKEGTKINEGGSEEDLLIASFSADNWNSSLGNYNINESNRMSNEIIDSSDSPSGKALRLKRETKGNKEAGYYLRLQDLTGGEPIKLENGSTYRFEYVVKGSGQWGFKTNQTSWYPCAPVSDKFNTCITTYKASSAQTCNVIFYAIEKTKDIYLEIDSVKIYKVR